MPRPPITVVPLAFARSHVLAMRFTGWQRPLENGLLPAVSDDVSRDFRRFGVACLAESGQCVARCHLTFVNRFGSQSATIVVRYRSKVPAHLRAAARRGLGSVVMDW
jgi:hypothetical protein